MSERFNRITFGLLLFAAALPALSAPVTADADPREITPRIFLAELLPPRTDTLPGPENKRCSLYASNAVADYETMRRFSECSVASSPRWQADYRNHYNWCLTARPEWLASEAKARSLHLTRCGVRKNM